MKVKPAYQTYKPFGYIDVQKAAQHKSRRSVLDTNVRPVSRENRAPSSVQVDNPATRHKRPKSAYEKRAIRNQRTFRIDPIYAAWKGIA